MDQGQSQPVGRPVPSQKPMHSPSRVPLEGRDVLLVAADPAHSEALFPGSHDTAEARQIWTYMPYGPFDAHDDMRRWLSEVGASTDPLFFVVIDRRSDRAIGMASYLNVDVVMRRLEIGHIWFVSDAQRTTANTEAAFLLAEHAFERLRARRLEWKCDALNLRSRDAALRLGFRYEGTLRNHMVVKGRNRDTAYFGMTDEDWPAVRSILREWLYELDRDSYGRPAGSLASMMQASAAGR